MTITELNRGADTDVPLITALSERWSPRAFDPDAIVDRETVRTILEAARWAPSANNTQPWRFIVARRGSDAFATIHAHLAGFNKAWADSATILIVNIAATVDDSGRPMKFARYDLGQAVAHLSVQAQHEGLHTHQIGGVDGVALHETFGLDASLEIVSVTALGVLGDPSALPEPLRQRESAPRTRRELRDSVLAVA